jgi:CheY-like chemotaxis protein
MSRGHILVVDDSELLLQVSKEALEAADFAVTAILTLDELEAVENAESIALILMDVQMPELFGDDVASVLRDVRGWSAPIYLFSSIDRDELQKRAEQAEVNGFISKHDGVEAMVRRVEEALGLDPA